VAPRLLTKGRTFKVLRMRENIVLTGIELIAVGESSLLRAQNLVVACQSCSASVSQPFSSVLTEVVGPGRTITEYVLCTPARCPNCSQPIVENTLVRCEGGGDDASDASLDFGRCWDSE